MQKETPKAGQRHPGGRSLLINARRSVQLQDVIRRWLGALDHPPGVRVAVDIDPYSFV